MTKIEVPILRIKGIAIGSDRYTGNRSLYSAEEIKKAYQTIVNKPINVNHVFEDIIGVVTSSSIEEDDKGNAYLYIEGLIWEYRFPDEAYQIRQMGNKVNVSVEALPQYIECPKCGHTCSNLELVLKSNVCEHLMTEGYRILRDLTFLGLAVVFPPKEPAYKTNVQVEEKLPLKVIDIRAITPELIQQMSDVELKELHKELHKLYELFRKKH